MLKRYEHYALAALPFVIVMLGVLLLIVLNLNSSQRSLTSATYLRFQTCVLNIPADTRSQVDVDRCWKAAEISTGVKVDHFDL